MDKIDTILQRGVDKIYPFTNALKTLLLSGKKLRVYQGFDPTAAKLHLGHLVGLKKLSHFQKGGHAVIFLIGDFTATIGDPTGKDKTRVPLTHQQVLQNARDYQRQTEKILAYKGNNPVQVLYNSQWLNKLTASDFMKLTSLVSYQQVIERDMFERRIKKKQDIRLSELLYPLLQGYDSIHLEVDVEIGGTDQMFNMLMGRELLKKVRKKEKFVITTPLLTDENDNKIGKTEGNVIALDSKAEDLYGRVMSLPDSTICKGLEYLTDYPTGKIREIEDKITSGENPMAFKKILSFNIVSELHSHQAALAAQNYFENLHQNKTLNVNTDQYTPRSDQTLVEVICSYLKISRSQVKRLIAQRSIDINGSTLDTAETEIKKGDIIRIGKHRLFKIT